MFSPRPPRLEGASKAYSLRVTFLDALPSLQDHLIVQFGQSSQSISLASHYSESGEQGQIWNLYQSGGNIWNEQN